MPCPVAQPRSAAAARYNANVATTVEVILRDFDGTETVYPTELPLRDVIHTGISDMEMLVTRAYAKTGEKDARGRPVYIQQ